MRGYECGDYRHRWQLNSPPSRLDVRDPSTGPAFRVPALPKGESCVQQDLNEALNETQDALRLAKIQFQIGEIDMQPVLQLEGAVLGAQTAVTGLQFERLANRINLHLALGGGF